MTVESYKGYQIKPVSRGGNFQISKSGKHMATGNSLVDARLMIDLHENYVASQQLPGHDIEKFTLPLDALSV